MASCRLAFPRFPPLATPWPTLTRLTPADPLSPLLPPCSSVQSPAVSGLVVHPPTSKALGFVVTTWNPLS